MKLCVFLYSDATVIVNFGTRSVTPLYMVLANVLEDMPEQERTVVVGFLPCLPEDQLRDLGIKKSDRATFRAQIFQKALEIIVRLGAFSNNYDPHGVVIGHETVYPVLAGYLGDRPELMMAAGMYKAQNGNLQHACRRCSVQGSELGIICEQAFVPDVDDVEEEVLEALAALEVRRHGTVQQNKELLQSLSRAEAPRALAKCRFFSTAACTPRCTLHTALLVISKYLLEWTMLEIVARDKSLSEVNERVFLVDPAIPELYKADQQGKWKLHPRVKTAQFKKRALFALFVAMRGFFCDPERDDVLGVLSEWHRVYALWTKTEFTEQDVEELGQAICVFRTRCAAVFKQHTAFAFVTQHELTHVPEDLLLYGSHRVTTTAQLEKLHKSVKELVRRSNFHDNASTWCYVLAEYVFSRLMLPPTAAADEMRSKPATFQLTGHGMELTLGQFIDKLQGRQPALKHLAAAWARTFHRNGAEGQSVYDGLRVHKQYKMGLLGKIRASEDLYSKARHDVILVRSQGRALYYRVIVVLDAICRSFLAPRDRVHFFVERLELRSERDAIFGMPLVESTNEFLLVDKTTISSIEVIYVPIPLPKIAERNQEYFLSRTDLSASNEAFDE